MSNEARLLSVQQRINKIKLKSSPGVSIIMPDGDRAYKLICSLCGPNGVRQIITTHDDVDRAIKANARFVEQHQATGEPVCIVIDV